MLVPGGQAALVSSGSQIHNARASRAGRSGADPLKVSYLVWIHKIISPGSLCVLCRVPALLGRYEFLSRMQEKQGIMIAQKGNRHGPQALTAQ